MESRNLTPHRGPSVWEHPPKSPTSFATLAVIAGAALGAALAWRYRSIGKALVTKSLGFGAMAIGFATSPTGRQIANMLMDRWAATRQSLPERSVDSALEDTFPASDPPALTYHA
jgi:hypothetical protein